MLYLQQNNTAQTYLYYKFKSIFNFFKIIKYSNIVRPPLQAYIFLIGFSALLLLFRF